MNSNFTQTKIIEKLLPKIEDLRENKYSDVVDSAGNQYVDLVQEGGGVLGIALVGYTYMLEKAGIRFFSLAGTSAGAINTMMVAGLDTIDKPKSEQILSILSEKALFELVDGHKAVRKLVKKAVEKDSGIGWTLVWHGYRIYKILTRQLGLNPGDNFTDWISGELNKAGISSLADLHKRRKTLPRLFDRDGKEISELMPKLAIITSDITTHTKVEFPKMTELYWSNPQEVNPALLVRASMSIPFFFEPFELKHIPNVGATEDKNWDKYARYYGEVPPAIKFVDGGMLSNFPINVFHREDGGVPRMPTFGARLSAYRKNYSKTNSIFQMSGAMISTMRQIHDYDFLLKHPDYRKLICRIDADQQFNWLDFNMSKSNQIKLFELGATKAVEFLETFDWEAYKNIRKTLA
ncbi:MAG: patatin-like phospholipase family protein [Fulvivirga sp.]|nr:patatin-like phospholipase family protein [Fulvivirga sp.]